MRGLTELVFSTTNQCTARCRDCPVVSGKDAPARLKPEFMMRIVDEVYGWGALRLVVFTGGESFLLGEGLGRTVAHVAEKGISTRIVTNAYWASSREKALKVLRDLKAKGLTEINISCDDYHQEFIPLDNVKHANDAALELGIPLLLAHRRKPGGQITVEYLSQYLGGDLHLYKKGEKNPDNNVICTGRNVPLDSSSDESASESWELPENDRDWMGACDSVMRSIVIASDLSVHTCCGIARMTIPELAIGSLSEDGLLAILQRGNQDLITNWLALEGPSSILDFVRSVDPSLCLPEHYANRCHLCNELFTREDVRSLLAKHGAARVEGLTLIRGTLDWLSEDWAASNSAAPAATPGCGSCS